MTVGLCLELTGSVRLCRNVERLETVRRAEVRISLTAGLESVYSLTGNLTPKSRRSCRFVVSPADDPEPTFTVWLESSLSSQFETKNEEARPLTGDHHSRQSRCDCRNRVSWFRIAPEQHPAKVASAIKFRCESFIVAAERH